MDNFLEEIYCSENECAIPYRGIQFKDGKCSEYIKGRVKNRFNDSEGISNSLDLFADTGFDTQIFKEILKNPETPKDWRIGETIAECVLMDNYNVELYFNSSRDIKNPLDNEKGADIIGYCKENEECLFTFAEVKSTSQQANPSVIYGESGLRSQLETLKSTEVKRDHLVRYLTHKVERSNKEWVDTHQLAIKEYINNAKEKVKIIGVLVRDSEPYEKTLKNTSTSLEENLSKNMKIELFSVYTKLEKNKWVQALVA